MEYGLPGLPTPFFTRLQDQREAGIPVRLRHFQSGDVLGWWRLDGAVGRLLDQHSMELDLGWRWVRSSEPSQQSVSKRICSTEREHAWAGDRGGKPDFCDA